MDDATKKVLMRRENVIGAALEGAVALIALADFVFGEAGGWAVCAAVASLGCFVARVSTAQMTAAVEGWRRLSDALRESQKAVNAAVDSRREFLDEMVDLCAGTLALQEAVRRASPSLGKPGAMLIDPQSWEELSLLCDRFREAIAKAKRDASPTIQ